jgi:hypothetical protein
MPDVTRPEWDVGDVVEWMGAPVAVLSTPHLDTDDNKWRCRAMYLSSARRGAIPAGMVFQWFYISDKTSWRRPLTGEQTVRLTKALLDGPC